MKQVILVGYAHEDTLFTEEFESVIQCLQTHSFSIAIEYPKGFDLGERVTNYQILLENIEAQCSEIGLTLDDFLEDKFNQGIPTQVKLAREAKFTYSIGIMLELIKISEITFAGIDDAELLETQKKIDISRSLEEFKKVSVARSAQMAANIAALTMDNVVVFIGLAHLVDVRTHLARESGINLRCLCFSNKPEAIPLNIAEPIKYLTTIINTCSNDDVVAPAISETISNMKAGIDDYSVKVAMPVGEEVVNSSSAFGM